MTDQPAADAADAADAPGAPDVPDAAAAEPPPDLAAAQAMASVPVEAAAPSPASTLPAPAAPAKQDDDEEDPFAPGIRWVKAHPLFALLLLAITFGGPYVLWAWRARAARERLSAVQEVWLGALSEAGLPVPWAPVARVPAPHQIDVPAHALDGLGLGAQQRALVGWQTLLAGGQVAPDKLHAIGNGPGQDWLAAVRACALLRACVAPVTTAPPSSLVTQARADAELAPAATRAALRLAADLVDGHADAVAADAARLLQEGPHPAARGALVVLRDEARRRRVALALERPSAVGLREVALFAREGLDVEPALAARGPLVAEAVTDLGGALALLEALEAAAPDGIASRPALAPLWQAALPAVQATVAERLRQFEDDPGPALAVLERLARVDPTADAPPGGFVGWREQLARVVNDPDHLGRFAARFFELGWVPAGFEELLAQRRVRSEGPSSGALLCDALVRTQRLLALPAAEREREQGDLEMDLHALEQTLEQRGGQRVDPIARRLRAQAAFTLGRLHLGAATPAAAALAVEALERARALGYEPAHALLGELARGHALRDESKRAVEAAQERLKALERTGELLAAGLAPEDVVAWELRGWPVDQLQLGNEQVSAQLDLAALHASTGDLDAAIEVAARAATVHPDHAARAHFARAEHLLAARRKDEALATALEALNLVRPHERALRDRIQALVDLLSR
jgi:tetratricopeptide (TPR) repeat protein